jgi:hypothetical protein
MKVSKLQKIFLFHEKLSHETAAIAESNIQLIKCSETGEARQCIGSSTSVRGV